jgi:hypothetical protein
VTFLQYLGVTLLGEPYRAGERWYWLCPNCGKGRDSFSTLPPKPPHKDRVICFRCGFRGDEYDLYRHCRPGDSADTMIATLERWRQEHAAGRPPTPDGVTADGSTPDLLSLPRGRGLAEPDGWWEERYGYGAAVQACFERYCTGKEWETLHRIWAACCNREMDAPLKGDEP